MQDLAARKAKLRTSTRLLLDGLRASEVAARSLRVQDRLFASSWWRRARWVFVFVAMPGEVDTAPILTRAVREARQTAIPRIEGGEIDFYRYDGLSGGLARNRFGILEPDPGWPKVDPRELAEEPLLILAPGLAFDRSLRRLGRGKGYYDRFLARARSGPRECLVVGLALAEQVVEAVPAGPWDQRMDGLITDRETIGLDPGHES